MKLLYFLAGLLLSVVVLTKLHTAEIEMYVNVRDAVLEKQFINGCMAAHRNIADCMEHLANYNGDKSAYR